MMKFTPKIDKYVNDYISQKENIKNICNMCGSPCNVIFPELMKNNINEFNDVFNKYRLKSKIFYAHKSNKSDSFVKQALYDEICIDVASENELKSALSNGFISDRIEATGPKNDSFIILGVQHLITFNVDSIEELNTIISYMKQINSNKKIKILLRISGFKSDNTKIISKSSKFGINISNVDEALKIIIENLNIVNFIGFSFHLDTTAIKEKVIAIENLINLFELAYEYNLNPYVIDIGGGYKVNYLLNKDEWNSSITSLKKCILGSNEDLTWNKNSYGLHQENKVLRGALNIYNYYDDLTGAKYLDELLSTKMVKYENRCIGDILSENMLEIYIEPGRALLNQMGITISKVTFCKQNDKSDNIIGLDMKRNDITMEDQDLFIDPIIISDNVKEKEQIGVYFSGNLCLETDLIFKHKVFVNVLPKKDDYVIFVNTAGYFMDFSATNSIKQNIAQKIVAIKKDNKYIHYMDKEYNPYIKN